VGQMEVLLEINMPRKELRDSKGELVYVVEREMGSLGMDGVLAYFSCPHGKRFGIKTLYLLQRWPQKWNSFVDVTDVDQVVDGDRLTIALQSSAPELKGGAESAGNCEPSTSNGSELDTTRAQVFNFM